jgi:hypothetical protein
MKNVVFWDVELCRSCVNRCFGWTYRLHLQGRKISERWTSVSRWLQKSVDARSTQRHIPGDDILHKYWCLRKSKTARIWRFLIFSKPKSIRLGRPIKTNLRFLCACVPPYSCLSPTLVLPVRAGCGLETHCLRRSCIWSFSTNSSWKCSRNFSVLCSWSLSSEAIWALSYYRESSQAPWQSNEVRLFV